MNKSALLLVTLLAALPAWAQFDGLAPALAKLKAATLAQDAQTLVAMTHPKAIAAQGGEEAALINAQESFLNLERRGLKQSALTLDTPTQFYPTKDDWVAFVPTHSRLQSKNQVVSEDGYLIAVRPKQDGSAWHFIDGAGVEVPQQIFDYFPGLPPDISIPKKSSKIRLITPWTPSKK